jgi:TonB family protein
VLALSLAASAAAQPPLTVRTLQHRMERLGELAKKGRWAAVERDAGRLANELRASLTSTGGIGDESSQVVAMVLTLQALAASADERPEDALWHWSLAQSLWPDLTRATLTAYGEPAALLRDNRLQLESLGCCGRDGCSEGEGGDQEARVYDSSATEEPEGEVRPPVRIEAPQPQFPLGARMSGQEGVVFVLAIIGEDGLIRQAIVPGYPSVALALAAVEPLRRWRFEPARLDGDPVEVYYCLRVNFDLR